MKNIDLSLNGILDDRWKLELVGKEKIKLTYNSVKGIPSIEETKKAIAKVCKAKKLDSVYISGLNGDILVYANNIKFEERKVRSMDDELSTPFGADYALLKMEDLSII